MNRRSWIGDGLVLFVAAAAFSACGDSPVAPADVTGTYDLVSLNGLPLPATVTLGGIDIEFDNGLLTLGPGDQCVLDFDLASVAQDFVGTYALSGSTITINVRSAGGTGIATIHGSGPVDGTSITVTDGDHLVWVFRKR